MQLQLLDTAIGLVTAFFLLSVVASAAVEVGSRLLRKRAKDLDMVLGRLIDESKHSGHSAANLNENYMY